jgi:hypothetical protein
MKMRYTIFFASILLAAWPALPVSGDETKSVIEYKVKAAFLFNFIKFVEWPDEQKTDVNAPITIGILCDDDLADHFGELESRKIRDRSIVVKKFRSFETADDKAGLARCQVVYVTTCMQKYGKETIAMLHKLPILVIGESDGFLEAGGMINFIIADGKVCFEINTKAADEAGLKIGSQLLRLAKRVIKNEKPRTSGADNKTFRDIRGVQ